MKISELPDGLRQLAIERWHEYLKKYKTFIKSDLLMIAFCWEETPEGRLFWNEIDEGNFEPYYELIKKEE